MSENDVVGSKMVEQAATVMKAAVSPARQGWLGMQHKCMN